MRCKCCDADNAEWGLDDWYCSDCAEAITEVIYEDSCTDTEQEGAPLSPQKETL